LLDAIFMMSIDVYSSNFQKRATANTETDTGIFEKEALEEVTEALEDVRRNSLLFIQPSESESETSTNSKLPK